MKSLGTSTRRYAHGAEVSGDGASFRVWAERARSVGLVLGDGREIALTPEAAYHPKSKLPARRSASVSPISVIVSSRAAAPAAAPRSMTRPASVSTVCAFTAVKSPIPE